MGKRQRQKERVRKREKERERERGKRRGEARTGGERGCHVFIRTLREGPLQLC